MTPLGVFNGGHSGFESPHHQLLNYQPEKKKKLSLCINVAFFTWGSLVYPCKHLADRLELYIFALKFFEWLILIKRKNLLEWFLFVSPCSSVFIFWCQISFGLMVWLYWFFFGLCVFSQNQEKLSRFLLWEISLLWNQTLHECFSFKNLIPI